MERYFFDADFAEDALKWAKILDDKKISRSNIDKLESLHNKLMLENDPALAYFFAQEFAYKLHDMQKIIINNNNVKYSYLFAQNIINSDIQALQKIVLNSKNAKYICKFACFVKGADILPLEEFLIKKKNAKYAHMYIKFVDSNSIDKFKDIILQSKKPRYLFELAKHTKNLEDLSKIEDIIIELKSFTYMRLLASRIKLCNISKIEQALLNIGNMVELKKFAKVVKKSKMRNFLLIG